MAYPGSPGSISNPNVPFVIPVDGGVYVGKIIHITGTIPVRASRFTINLQNGQAFGESPMTDVALHLSVRFNEGCVVRNSYENGSWRTEERWGGNPFRPGQGFELMILVDPSEYKIAVNNKHFTEFVYRLPKEMGYFLKVDGDIRIRDVRFGPV